jgi:hypothetical protein
MLMKSTTFFANKKVAGAQKNCCSISPMIETPNLKLKLAHCLPNPVCCLLNLCAKKASQPVCEKKQRTYVDKIDPLNQFHGKRNFLKPPSVALKLLVFEVI